MALVFPQPRSFKVPQAPATPVKEVVLSLTVPKGTPRMPGNSRASVQVVDGLEDTLTTAFRKNSRRYQALANAAPAKQISRFCRCGCELLLEGTPIPTTQLRISTTPGVLLDGNSEDAACIHVTQALTIARNGKRKPKERRGVQQALVARRESVIYDW